MVAATLFPFAPDTTRGWTVLGGCLLLTLVLAEVSHHVVETPVRRHGFLRSLRRLVAWSFTPWQVRRLPRVVAGAAAVLVLLAGFALATAPEKSRTQRAIEASEAELVGEGAAEPGSGPAADGAGKEEAAKEEAAKDGAGKDGAGKDGAGGNGAAGEAAREGSQQQQQKSGGGADGRDRPQALPDAAPDSWRVDAEGLAVPPGEQITAIGDSLVITSADGLRHRFPGIDFEAKSNRQWRDAQDVLEQALAQGRVRDNVVVHFGTNAGVDVEEMDTFLDTLGSERRVVLMNLYSTSTFVPDSNQAIQQAAAGRDNVVVGDWAGAIAERPGDLQSDRVHPDIPGMHVYAAVVAESFDALVRDG